MERLTIDDVKVSARSKREAYHLLCVQGNIFLPLIEQSNQKFIKKLIDD